MVVLEQLNTDIRLPNPLNINIATGGNNAEEDSTLASYLKKQSVRSVPSGGDSMKALTIIYEMLVTYNNMIEANTNSIKENSSLQDSNFAAMRSVLDYVINAINGISQRVLALEDGAHKSDEVLTAIGIEVASGIHPTAQTRLGEFDSRVEKNEMDMAFLKESTQSIYESVMMIEGRLETLENRLSNIGSFLMRLKKHNQNEAVAKMA